MFHQVFYPANKYRKEVGFVEKYYEVWVQEIHCTGSFCKSLTEITCRQQSAWMWSLLCKPKFMVAICWMNDGGHWWTLELKHKMVYSS